MRLFLFSIFVGFLLPVYAQNAYKAGSTIENFKAETILNYEAKKADFNSLKKQITIVDFFGTWCIPCLRALPHLDSIQKQFPDNVRVMLISVEKETALQKFVDDKKAKKMADRKNRIMESKIRNNMLNVRDNSQNGFVEMYFKPMKMHKMQYFLILVKRLF